MNFIIENFKKPKTILIVLGLTAIIVSGVMIAGYGSYLRTSISIPSIHEKTCNVGENTPDLSGANTKKKCEKYCAEKGYSYNSSGVRGYDNLPNGMTDSWYPNRLAIIENFSNCAINAEKPTNDRHKIGGVFVCRCNVPEAPATCNQTFEVRNENNKAIPGSKITVNGSSCNTDSNGSCSMKLKKNETHTATATKSDYECYNNKCSKTFTGCPPEWIPLFLKKTVVPTCTENDGGINVYKKSTTKDNSGSYTDYCDGNKLIEYYCRDGVAKKNYPTLCSRYGQVGQNMICDDGACKEAPESPPACGADGKCKTSGCSTGDPDCSCAEQGGYICHINEVCQGTSLLSNYEGFLESDTCCSVACAPAAIYSISGKITSSEDISSSRIAINLTGTSSASTTTDSSGSYSFNDLANGSYVVTPSDGSWIISPASHNAAIFHSNTGEINFTATPVLCKQDFKVQDENSNPIAGAEVLGRDAFPEVSQEGGPVCYTDNNGLCSFELRWTEKNHTAEAKKDGYECYNNECQRTFDGCLDETIVLKLKKPADFQTADLNCDGNVNNSDFAILLSWWNKNPSGFTSCQSPDINNDGNVNNVDFGIIMSQWTKMTL